MAYFSHIMKTLIIHPEDPTTTFLSPIYANLKSKTVVKGGATKSELRTLIDRHDRFLMLGHGLPEGLLNTGSFEDTGLFVIDETIVGFLRTKKENLFIWCHADQFVRNHELSGICSGMFISELGEARSYGYKDVVWNIVNQSNYRFSEIISRYINEPLEILYIKLISEYGILAKSNPIANFNMERLTLT